jgi:hypothetical protein
MFINPSTSVYFSYRDLNYDTGIYYIYNELNSLIPRNVKIIEEGIKYNFRYFKFLQSTVFILTILLFRFLSKKNKFLGLYVGAPNTFKELLFIYKNSLDIYLVDSVYDFYEKKFLNTSKPFKILILFLPYLYELLIIMLSRRYFFLNSTIRTESLIKRMPYLCKFGRRIEFLPIGISKPMEVGTKLNNKHEITIGIWGNFKFYENLRGLIDFIKWAEIRSSKINYKVTLLVCGNGALDLDINLDSITIKKMGRVSNLTSFYYLCDAFVLTGLSTNGIKTKFLELLSCNKPFLAFEHNFSHLGIPSLNFNNCFSPSDGDTFNEFITFIKDFKKSENPIIYINWKNFFDIINSC